MSQEEPIVAIKAVNIKDWIMNPESGVLEHVVVRHVVKYRRSGWSKDRWELLQVEEEDEKYVK